jgi:predicted RNA binding protein YcfA (HicA-like mRNA interferase family)
MKRRALPGHLQEHGCLPLREGGSHSIWRNPQTGRKESIPVTTKLKNTWRAPSAATSRFPCLLAINGPKRKPEIQGCV